MCVAVVGSRETEIGQGWAGLTLRCRYRANALGVAWPSKRQDGAHMGSIYVGWNMCLAEVGGRDTEIG